MVFENILPGFSLMQAQRDSNDWKAGQYGLVECNDPTVIFDGPLLLDPTSGLSDAQVNALSPLQDCELSLFQHQASNLALKLKLDALSGYRLVNACFEAGYSLDEGRVEFWLLHYLASKVRSTSTV